MSLGVDADDGGGRMSARSKRKAKEKANARKRAAGGNVVNPYAVLESEDKDGEEDQEAEPVQETRESGVNDATTDDGRPKTSGSDASGETLVGAHHSRAETPVPTCSPRRNDHTTEVEEPKTTSREWTYDELPDITPPDSLYPGLEDPDEPLTEIEIRHKEIDDWLLEHKGHHFQLKQTTANKIVDFVYGMKYEEDRVEWMKEVRLIVWRAAVRSNFWWTNPDTGLQTGKPVPILAPTGVYEQNFAIFVQCAAERLDRIGRDLPDPEYVAQIEAALRLFFRRLDYKNLVRPLEHFAFLLLIDEEQNRVLTKEGLQSRLRMCFDRVRAMSWSGMGVVSMGEWPLRKTDPPLRQEVVWEAIVKRWL